MTMTAYDYACSRREDVDATLDLAPGGDLRAIRLLRWSNLTPDGRYAWVPYSGSTVEVRMSTGVSV